MTEFGNGTNNNNNNNNNNNRVANWGRGKIAIQN